MTSNSQSALLPDEVGDVMAFLTLVMDPDGPKARESFERICHLRVKEVNPALSATIASFAESNNLSYLKGIEIYWQAVQDPSCRELEQLVRIIRTMHQEKLPPAETISLLKRTQRLGEYYNSIKVPPGVIYEPMRKLGILEEEARKFQSVTEFVKSQLAIQQAANGAGATEKAVHVLNIHESKGREFPVAFVIGQGVMPAQGADFEEERRLFYVAFTRAKELVYLSYPANFANESVQPSSFLVDARLMLPPAMRQMQLPQPAQGANQQTAVGRPAAMNAPGTVINAAPNGINNNANNAVSGNEEMTNFAPGAGRQTGQHPAMQAQPGMQTAQSQLVPQQQQQMAPQQRPAQQAPQQPLQQAPQQASQLQQTQKMASGQPQAQSPGMQRATGPQNPAQQQAAQMQQTQRMTPGQPMNQQIPGQQFAQQQQSQQIPQQQSQQMPQQSMPQRGQGQFQDTNSQPQRQAPTGPFPGFCSQSKICKTMPLRIRMWKRLCSQRQDLAHNSRLLVSLLCHRMRCQAVYCQATRHRRTPPLVH